MLAFVSAVVAANCSDHSKKLLFFAASGYSHHAIEYPELEQIALFLHNPDGSLEPPPSALLRVLSTDPHRSRSVAFSCTIIGTSRPAPGGAEQCGRG